MQVMVAMVDAGTADESDADDGACAYFDAAPDCGLVVVEDVIRRENKKAELA